ncbi:MAG: hypothetical protein ACTMKY_01840 [Dermabacteraceae bacterium]|uniref:hypothetical protein n=1 Tax=Brachybacterium paraconglomeratum TaxID=173362 RepID=UPI0031EA4078
MTASAIGRRGVLVGIIGSLLTACGLGGRSDVTAVQEALRGAVQALPEHLDGKVQFQDSTSAGTTISGVLVLAGRDRAEIEQSLLIVLETVSDTYDQQSGVRTAFVRIEGHPEGDRGTRVVAADVVTPTSGANVTTEDLAAHFGG